MGEEVTLTNCDREPIHIPGHAQAHGVVVCLALHDEFLTILQVSANIEQYCGVSFADVIGQGASSLFGADQILTLRDAVAEGALESNPIFLFTGLICGQGPFQCVAHTDQGLICVELEPARSETEERPSHPDPHSLLKQALFPLRSADTLRGYCHAVCEAIQQISGYDRVMVYRFHSDGHGEVVGEKIGESDTRGPYLGLHYPESDIPKQARALYLINSIRLMPDALYNPAPLIPDLNPRTARPLDMTHCMLRGYSRMYTEYLTNMGARASMSLAIVQNGELWGLIACHHQTYRNVGYDVRTACEILANIVSLQIGDKQRHDAAKYRESSLNVHLRLIETMVLHKDMLNGLTDASDGGVTALGLLKSDGCAVISGDECRLLGETPAHADILELVTWLRSRSDGESVFATDDLTATYPQGAKLRDLAAGLLALHASSASTQGEWILWFRREISRTVNWGGDPNKPYLSDSDGDRLTPRKSFELWRETVDGRSQPWTDSEIEAARRLRTAIAEVIVRRTEELSRLSIELKRSNEELESFAYFTSHDLKEPLRGINNYIQFLREDHAESFPPEAEQKLDTVVRLTRRMDSLLDSLLYYSRVGRQELDLNDVDMNRLVEEALETIRPRMRSAGVEMRTPHMPAAFIRCDAIQVGELLINLIANAIKYNDRPAGEKWVEIGCDAFQAPPVFWVRDNGIGISEKHFAIVFRIFKRLHARGEYGGGTGAGLTISQKIVERHGGRLWLESHVGEGSTFFFTLHADFRK